MGWMNVEIDWKGWNPVEISSVSIPARDLIDWMGSGGVAVKMRNEMDESMLFD